MEKDLKELEERLKKQDWYYQRKSGSTYYDGKRNFDMIQVLLRSTGKEGKKLFGKYAKGDWSSYNKDYLAGTYP